MPKMKPEKALIRIRPRVRSREVASFFAQLDDQSRRMLADMASCTPAELAWQPKRGQNTIGMLLAHNALVEAFWLVIAAERCQPSEAIGRLGNAMGVGFDIDGMPLPAGERPPQALAGWTMARYRRLHDRARAYAKRVSRGWDDAYLEPTMRYVRMNGQVRILNVRWILYHVLEHQAGHYGQMLLLRHQYRDRAKKK